MNLSKMILNQYHMLFEEAIFCLKTPKDLIEKFDGTGMRLKTCMQSRKLGLRRYVERKYLK